MAATMPYVQWWKGSYRFRRSIPKELQPTLGNKKYFPTKPLGTADKTEANRLVIPHIEETNRLLALAEARMRRPADDEAIELIVYGWLGSIAHDPLDESEREIPFQNEDDLVASLNSYLDSNDLKFNMQTFEQLKREAVSQHVSDFGGFAPLVQGRKKARMEVTVALSRGSMLPPAALAVLDDEQQPFESASLPRTMATAIPHKGKQISVWAIYDDWAGERRAATKTVYSWRQIINKLTEHVGHDDAGRIGEADVIAWKDALVKSQLAPKTIKNHLTIVKTLFNWATANRRILSNPASAVKYKAKADPSKRKIGYNNEDTKLILSAARMEKEAHKRWVPWLGASTGARLDEICGAMVRDIDVIDGVHCLHIRLDHREEGGSLKNENSTRVVPLHPAIIADGFLDYVASLPKNGALFPKVTPDRFGKRGGNGSKTIGRWIRKKIGITDRRIQPNHAWRHRFKTQCRNAGIEEEVHDYLTGHGGGGEGRNYGDYGMDVLAEAVAKINVPAS